MRDAYISVSGFTARMLEDDLLPLHAAASSFLNPLNEPFPYGEYIENALSSTVIVPLYSVVEKNLRYFHK